MLSFLNSSANSSSPTKSAPLSLASFSFEESVKTANLISLPREFGKATEPLTFSSDLPASIPKLIAMSMDSSKFFDLDLLNISRASPTE